MLAFLEEIVRRFGPLFEDAGYQIIAGAVLLERSIFVGLIVPGDVVLALGGIYASRAELGLGWVMLVAALAAAIGESTGYWLGRRFGPSLVARIPLVNRLADRLDAAQDYFGEHGGKTVAIGRFATVAGSFIPFAAGVGRMPYHRFLLFDLPAVGVWAVGITLIGYYFGENLDFVDKVLQ
ncbi:MAG: DedA family protein, partial [Actinomycetota bacterium]